MCGAHHGASILPLLGFAMVLVVVVPSQQDGAPRVPALCCGGLRLGNGWLWGLDSGGFVPWKATAAAWTRVLQSALSWKVLWWSKYSLGGSQILQKCSRRKQAVPPPSPQTGNNSKSFQVCFSNQTGYFVLLNPREGAGAQINRPPSQRCVGEMALPWLNPSAFLLGVTGGPSPAAGRFPSQTSLLHEEEAERWSSPGFYGTARGSHSPYLSNLIGRNCFCQF